jgi:hypothetical protein
MAILQISRIQVRRGLQQDLPQLASGEFGWSMDQRRLFIGNGTIDEGAPTQGRTEIVTAPSLTSIGTDLLQYSFKGTKSGYISQTGSSVLSPVYRALQEVLDETVTVTDFGATGDGTTDDTAAINRAIQQIYVSSLLSTVPVRRTIRFPAGTYKVTGTILIQPYCTLLGSGKNNSVITSTSATVFTTADSLYQSGIGSLGTNSATLPTSIAIGYMGFTTTGGTNPAVVIDSTRDILFKSVYFSAASGATNVVTITNSATTASTGVTFENCTFNGAATGLGATTISGFAGVGVRVKDSIFTNNSTAGIAIGSVLSGLVSENNYFDTTVTAGITGITGNNYSFGDTYASGDNAGIYSGSAKTGTGRSVALTGSNVVATLTTGAGSITYQINDSSNNYRYGTLKYNKTATVLSFDDEYTEPATALSANLWAHANGSVICTTTGSYTLKYNITQFV